MAAGLAVCGLLNFAFGWSSTAWSLGLLAIVLRDTPESMGVPPIESRDECARVPKGGFGHLVFGNRYIWLVAVGNLFVYTVRYGILDWGPTFLKQARHIDLTRASWMVAAFEGAGILGMLSSAQTLLAIAAANLATKQAAATAVGLTGFFGYLSTVLSGVGVGWLVERHGWDAGFLMFIAAAVAGMLLFILCWPARADAYERS